MRGSRLQPSLKNRALRMLAQREHTRSELEIKLARHVQEGDDLPALLDTLEAKGFISTERVVESVLHRRAPLLGAQRVMLELRRKGLDDALVRAAGEKLAATEWERACAVWEKRFGNAPPPASYQEKARQMRFLAARGFAADVVRRVVQAAGHAKGNADPFE